MARAQQNDEKDINNKIQVVYADFFKKLAVLREKQNNILDAYKEELQKIKQYGKGI